MTKFVEGIKTLFTGPDTSAADEAARRARETGSIAQDRQRQEVQAQAATTDAQLGRASRAPRGRRLLMAATGEAGVSSNLAGT